MNCTFDTNVLVYAIVELRPSKGGRARALLARCARSPAAAGPEDLDPALQLAQDHGLALWDARLCATADRAGLRYLISEDMPDGRRIGNLAIVSPFRPENAAPIDRILPA